MTLLAFLITSVTVLTMLFVGSARRATEGRDLAVAIAHATNVAEAFSADPTAEASVTQVGDLTVSCVIDDVPTARGTLRKATVSVYAEGQEEPVYSLSTARYVRGEGE